MNERSGATAEKPHDYRSAIKTDEILIKRFKFGIFVKRYDNITTKY